jgi:small subunit ribosomal protein S6
MKERHYESVVLINAALEDEKIQEIIGKIKEMLTNGGVTNLEVEDWGRKRLAYAVKKSKTGYYALFRYISTPDFISKIERSFNLNEQIYRSLTILLSKEDIAFNTKKSLENESVPEEIELVPTAEIVEAETEITFEENVTDEKE